MGKKYPCDQLKCTYLMMGLGCKPCDDCHTESYVLDDVCDRCWNCSKDEGILRWDDNKPDFTQDIKDIKKEIDKPKKVILIKNG